MADLMEGVTGRTVKTPRLATRVLESGPSEGEPVLFIHGNVSSSRFFEETLAALAPGYRGLAVDLRGFDGSGTKPVDATRGLRDFSDDVKALADTLGLARFHLAGWSLGGSVAMQYAMDYPERVASLTLICPMSPYGFGGTRDASGAPCWPDHAGSGGGTVNPEFVRRLEEGDWSDEDPNSPRNVALHQKSGADTRDGSWTLNKPPLLVIASNLCAKPRNVMNSFYFKPPFRASEEREEVYVSSMLSTRTGDDNYPGDAAASENWPNAAPGARGVNNAISPKYCDLSGFASAFAGFEGEPDVLWVRGEDDAIVSETSLLDLGYLGQLGVIPGWPGEEIFPPQPMISQTRAVLDAYAANGGSYREEALPGCGHSPHVEKPAEFQRLLLDFLQTSARNASSP